MDAKSDAIVRTFTSCGGGGAPVRVEALKSVPEGLSMELF